MRVGETNILVPFPCLCLYSIKNYWQKGGNTAQCAPSKGHLRSPELFLGITFDWIEIQTRGLYHWVCFVKAHRLICNMTYMNQHMTLKLRNWPIEVIKYMLRTGSTSEAHWCYNNGSNFNTSRFIHEKLFSHKTLFWPLMTSRTLNTDLSSKPIWRRR